jgi:hypothetical protein
MTHEPSYDTEPTYGMRNALRLVLLFYTVGEWSRDRKEEWKRLTGTYEATTKVLCDHVRSALAVGCVGDAQEYERIYGLPVGHVLTERDHEDIQNLLGELNDAEGNVESYHRGRLDGAFAAGGQEAVDKLVKSDEAFSQKMQKAALDALDRWKDMGVRR